MNLVERCRSEYRYLVSAARMLRRVTPIARRGDWTFPDMVADQARRYGDRPALLSADERLTYAELDRRANRYARWARAAGVGKDDVVCLIMPNRPDYVAIWLGIARAGGVTALVNTHIAGAALAQSIDIVAPRQVIVAAALAESFDSARPHLKAPFRLWSHGGTVAGAEPLEAATAALSGDALQAGEGVDLTLDDRCLYIYTSGTTGQPKAANVNHYRIQAIAHGFSAAMQVRPEDRYYVCLPLYHSAGGVLAIGAALAGGASVFMRERFSAREFWPDVVANGCTLFQYIGEVCRYLVNAPASAEEAQHRIRLCCGNGLRPDIWEPFQRRFAIPKILEYYAATEGNIAIFNFDGRPGSVGRIASWARHRFPLQLIRVDMESEEPRRGPDGLCELCADDEVGELVSEIVADPKKPAQRFEGYADAEATRRKILADVVRPGDAWFRSGDLLRRDADGYYYFVDRVGDTFRRKGENVSTMQVAEIVGTCQGVDNVTVYGVDVAGREGKVGMATIVPAPDFDLQRLHDHCRRHLAEFARPVFVRLAGAIETTGTYKQRKLNLQRQGYDIGRIADPVYVDHPENCRYEPLDAALVAAIEGGKLRI